MKFAPTKEQANARLELTLFPSPMKATFIFSKVFFFSYIVSMSAKAWQGCSKSERAFITGTFVFLDKVSKD